MVEICSGIFAGYRRALVLLPGRRGAGSGADSDGVPEWVWWVSGSYLRSWFWEGSGPGLGRFKCKMKNYRGKIGPISKLKYKGVYGRQYAHILGLFFRIV